MRRSTSGSSGAARRAGEGSALPTKHVASGAVSRYRPPLWLPGGHAQTIAAAKLERDGKLIKTGTMRMGLYGTAALIVLAVLIQRPLAELQIGKSYVNCRQDTAMPHGLPWHPRLSERLGLFRLVECDGSHEMWFSNPAVLARAIEYFRRERLQYTTEPPLLGRDSIDEFLFLTRQGFCEHFSSAFV